MVLRYACCLRSGYVLDSQAETLGDSEPRRCQQNCQHAELLIALRCDVRNPLGSERRALLLLHLGEFHEFTIPLAREQRLAALRVFDGTDNQLHQRNVGFDRLWFQTAVNHLIDQAFERAVVDFDEQQIPEMRNEPLVEGTAPTVVGGRADGLATTCPLLLQEHLGLLAERRAQLRAFHNLGADVRA